MISADSKPRGASLTMLKFAGDEFDALELVHRPTDSPVDIGTGFSHLAIQIDNLKATVEAFPWSKQHRQIPPPAQSPESGDDYYTNYYTDSRRKKSAGRADQQGRPR